MDGIFGVISLEAYMCLCWRQAGHGIMDMIYSFNAQGGSFLKSAGNPGKIYKSALDYPFNPEKRVQAAHIWESLFLLTEAS